MTLRPTEAVQGKTGAATAGVRKRGARTAGQGTAPASASRTAHAAVTPGCRRSATKAGPFTRIRHRVRRVSPFAMLRSAPARPHARQGKGAATRRSRRSSNATCRGSGGTRRPPARSRAAAAGNMSAAPACASRAREAALATRPFCAMPRATIRRSCHARAFAPTAGRAPEIANRAAYAAWPARRA